MQCTSCSLVYVSNPLSESELVDQYAGGASSKIAYYQDAAPADVRTFREILGTIERHTPVGRILDVGCNIGTFVGVATERGWEATGVDVNPKAVCYGRKQFGLDLMNIEEFDQQSRDFDVIHTSDTIEHLVAPLEVMTRYVDRLRPGGVLFVSTPNYDSLLCRLLQLKPTEHINVFNNKSLACLMSKLGLQVVECSHFDRFRNLAAMEESTTFDGFPWLQRFFRTVQNLQPELTIRVRGKENVMAIGRAPLI